MKEKTKEKWGAVLIVFGIVILTAGIVGAALTYKLIPNFESNPFFVLSVIGIVMGAAFLFTAGLILVPDDSFSQDTFHFHDYQ